DAPRPYFPRRRSYARPRLARGRADAVGPRVDARPRARHPARVRGFPGHPQRGQRPREHPAQRRAHRGDDGAPGAASAPAGSGGLHRSAGGVRRVDGAGGDAHPGAVRALRRPAHRQQQVDGHASLASGAADGACGPGRPAGAPAGRPPADRPRVAPVRALVVRRQGRGDGHPVGGGRAAGVRGHAYLQPEGVLRRGGRGRLSASHQHPLAPRRAAGRRRVDHRRRAGAPERQQAGGVRRAGRRERGGDGVRARPRAPLRTLRQLGAQPGHAPGPAAGRHEERRRTRADPRLVRRGRAAGAGGDGGHAGPSRVRPAAADGAGNPQPRGRGAHLDGADRAAVAERQRLRERRNHRGRAQRDPHRGHGRAGPAPGSWQRPPAAGAAADGLHPRAGLPGAGPRADGGRAPVARQDRAGDRQAGRLQRRAHAHGPAHLPRRAPRRAVHHGRPGVRRAHAGRQPAAFAHQRGAAAHAHHHAAHREPRQQPARRRREPAAAEPVGRHRVHRRRHDHAPL
ncbi:MAG: N-acyl-L-amino acid amidohydrolase, partial [uncultured Gemmatimonadetes bacterium]